MKLNKLTLTLASAAISFTAFALQQNQEMTKLINNPLLRPYNTPYATIPFDEIKTGHFMPAIKYGIEEQAREIEAIVKNTDTPTYDNTIAPYERTGAILSRALSALGAINGAETSPEIQAILKEASPLLSKAGSDINFNRELFKKFEYVYNNRANENLRPDQLYYLERRYKSWAKSGIGLPEDKQEQLRKISMELGQLSLKYNESVLAETNAWSMHFTDEKALDGLPEYAMDAAALEAKNRGLDGWVITLKGPSYSAVRNYAKDRGLRKTIALAMRSVANHDNEYDNKQTAVRIAALRLEHANILGYKTYSDLVLEDRMAKSAENVNALLGDLLSKAKPAAENEIKKVQEFARQLDGIKNYQSYDNGYYSRLLKEKEFSINSEELKQYFALDSVLQGVFAVANKLYGLTFTEVFNIQTYNPEVRTWVVRDENGGYKAIFYGDYFPREGKRAGAWMNDLRSQNRTYGDNQAPHIINVCNFTRPTEDAPSLLSFDEVTTLFHEFGHALHGMLSDVEIESQSGTSVPRDFVELPSHLMENWAKNPEVLQSFAKHYKTGEPIPAELVANVVRAANFMEGTATLGQLSYGMLDMAWHSATFTAFNRGRKKDTVKFEHSAMAPAELLKPLEGTLMSTSFSHIFSGGYAAGYYSYKWSEVLEADTFEWFKENGILSREAGKKFEKEILSRGGSGDVSEMYRKFRGRDAKPDALLRRAGLMK